MDSTGLIPNESFKQKEFLKRTQIPFAQKRSKKGASFFEYQTEFVFLHLAIPLVNKTDFERMHKVLSYQQFLSEKNTFS